LNEANKIIFYSDKLSGQIPRSYAANAFNTFQYSSFSFEILRLCALWDNAAKNCESIPTVVALIDDPEVLRALGADISSKWDEKFGELQKRKLVGRLKRSINRSKEIKASSLLTDLVNFRDKRLAHALDRTNRENKGHAAQVPKVGDEVKLLKASMTIVQNLYLGICNADFDLKHSQDIARKNAMALWGQCKFDIKK
jgi:hypothetical protein